MHPLREHFMHVNIWCIHSEVHNFHRMLISKSNG